MGKFMAHETPDPHPYHKSYRELWKKGWVAEMGLAAFAVYETLRMYANYETGRCYPCQSTLMAETGIKSAHTLRKHINRLVDLGVVEIVTAPTPNSPTEYRIITAPYLPDLAEEKLRGANSDRQKMPPARGKKCQSRGAKFTSREGQKLPPNKKKITRRREQEEGGRSRTREFPQVEVMAEGEKTQQPTGHFHDLGECREFLDWQIRELMTEPKMQQTRAECIAGACNRRLRGNTPRPEDEARLARFRAGERTETKEERRARLESEGQMWADMFRAARQARENKSYGQ